MSEKVKLVSKDQQVWMEYKGERLPGMCSVDMSPIYLKSGARLYTVMMIMDMDER